MMAAAAQRWLAPAFRLRDLITEGTCSAVLICSPDRLARNYAYQVLVIDEFKRFGCEAVFLNHAFGDSPEQQMLLQMQGVFAEYERALITERTRRGRLFWARQGRGQLGRYPDLRLSPVPRHRDRPSATGRRGA
jgi:site-specific DNA recombinase